MECRNGIYFLNCDIRYAFKLKMRPNQGFFNVQLLPKIFLDSDFCHNYLHTPVVYN